MTLGQGLRDNYAGKRKFLEGSMRVKAAWVLAGMLLTGCGPDSAEVPQTNDESPEQLGDGIVYLDCRIGDGANFQLTLNEAMGTITSPDSEGVSTQVYRGSFGPQTVSWAWPDGIDPDLSWKLSRVDLSIQQQNHFRDTTSQGTCVLIDPGDRAF